MSLADWSPDDSVFDSSGWQRDPSSPLATSPPGTRGSHRTRPVSQGFGHGSRPMSHQQGRSFQNSLLDSSTRVMDELPQRPRTTAGTVSMSKFGQSCSMHLTNSQFEYTSGSSPEDEGGQGQEAGGRDLRDWDNVKNKNQAGHRWKKHHRTIYPERRVDLQELNETWNDWSPVGKLRRMQEERRANSVEPQRARLASQDALESKKMNRLATTRYYDDFRPSKYYYAPIPDETTARKISTAPTQVARPPGEKWTQGELLTRLGRRRSWQKYYNYDVEP